MPGLSFQNYHETYEFLPDLAREYREQAVDIAFEAVEDEEARNLICRELKLSEDDEIMGEAIKRLLPATLTSKTFTDVIVEGGDLDRFVWLQGLDQKLQTLGFAGLEDDLCGPELILDEDFEDWVRDYAEQTQSLGINLNSWPANHIDWAAAAAEEKDYFRLIEYAGREYRIRG
jgi:hypothetical protein